MLVRLNRPAFNHLTCEAADRYVSSGPGADRSMTGSGKRLHQGADFGGQRLEPILAWADGVVHKVSAQTATKPGCPSDDPGKTVRLTPGPGSVTFAADLDLDCSGGGLVVHLIHAPLGVNLPHVGDAPIHSIVGHCAAVFVRPGERVQAGQVIAAMGSSGVRSGFVHSHFGIFAGPVGDVLTSKVWCLDPRGFQRWTSEGKDSRGNSTKKGSMQYGTNVRRLWPIDHVVVSFCFPVSDTAHGVPGRDFQAPTDVTDPNTGDSKWVSGRGGASVFRNIRNPSLRSRTVQVPRVLGLVGAGRELAQARTPAELAGAPLSPRDRAELARVGVPLDVLSRWRWATAPKALGGAGFGDVVCVEGDCKLGESLIAQMKGFYEALSAKPGAWYTDPALDTLDPQRRAAVIQKYGPAVAGILKANQDKQTFARRWVPFHPNCCAIRDIGKQAQDLMQQMAADSGVAAPTKVPVDWTDDDITASIGGAVKGVAKGVGGAADAIVTLGIILLALWGGSKILGSSSAPAPAPARRKAAA